MVPGRMMALIFDIILYMQLNLLEPMNVLKVRSLALAMFCACLSVPVAGQLRQQSFLSEKWDFRLDRDEAEDVWEQVDVPTHGMRKTARHPIITGATARTVTPCPFRPR